MSRALDLAFMEMAYGLAEKARGRSAQPARRFRHCPQREDVGWGYHEEAGKPHAEIVALRRAGRGPGGDDLHYARPCVHWGRTSPCADTLLAAGLEGRISAYDPNPIVHRRGVRKLGRRAWRQRRAPPGKERPPERGLHQVHHAKGPLRDPQGRLEPGRQDRVPDRRLQLDLRGRNERLRPSPPGGIRRPDGRRQHAPPRRPAPDRPPSELGRKDAHPRHPRFKLRFPLTARILDTSRKVRSSSSPGAGRPRRRPKP